MTNTRVLTLWDNETINEEDSLILRRICDDLPIPLDTESKKAIKTLVDAFLERDDASGLAAPQIGITKKVIIFRNKGFEKDGASDGKWSKKDVEVLINPRITQNRGDKVVLSEGCLSCPDIKVDIARFPEIKVRGYDMHGQKISKRYLDYVARIVQHEMDHLEGKLIVDYEGSLFVPRKKKGFFEKLLANK
ncbi:MAG: Peptide deformylase [Syntrophus sp. SKADARSKE-3]|nr:Peptide deformylase [Syntrophus sp. SKADARSKE-3]